MKEGTKVELLTSICGFEKGDIGVVKKVDSPNNKLVWVIVENRISTSDYSPYVRFQPDELKILQPSLKEFLETK